MIRFLLVLVACAIVLGSASCTTEKTPEPSTNADSCITSGQVISYSQDIVPILATYCTDPSYGSCHQSISDPNASGFDYTTYDGFAAEISPINNVQTFVLGPSATMPKAGTLGPTTLTDCDKLKLQTWIDQGFPNN